MLQIISDKWIEISALVISIVSICISLSGFLKSIVKLKIISENDVNFSVGYVQYSVYSILFLEVTIENISTSDTDFSNAKIFYKSKEYNAELFQKNACMDSNYDGIMLYNESDNSNKLFVKLRKCNILGDRIPSHGSIKGYITFMDFPILDCEEIVKLIIHTPTKNFTKKIKILPLPNKFQVANPLSEEQRIEAKNKANNRK